MKNINELEDFIKQLLEEETDEKRKEYFTEVLNKLSLLSVCETDLKHAQRDVDYNVRRGDTLKKERDEARRALNHLKRNITDVVPLLTTALRNVNEFDTDEMPF